MVFKSLTFVLSTALIGKICWQYKHFITKWNIFIDRFNRLVTKVYSCDWDTVNLKEKKLCEKDISIISFYI